MSYVGPEERAALAREADAQKRAAMGRAHIDAVEDAAAVLRQLDGTHTNAFMEVLTPAPIWRRKGDDLVVLRDKSRWLVSEVVSVYWLKNAMIWHPPPNDYEASDRVSDAYVAPDGRLWENLDPVHGSTFQTPHDRTRRLDMQNTENLRRIAEALRARVAQG